ncbi:MAG: hypothetical protein APR62_08380 [Smithella sp. SDB]|nr:MAG: hypothetical protein APR62_08380 [Smithella sp. SDB]
MPDEFKRILPELIKKLYRQNRLSALKWFYECLRRIFKRRLNLFFCSPQKALKDASDIQVNQNKLLKLKSIISEADPAYSISVHENVIAYPLVSAPRNNRPGSYFFGGLANNQTQTLLDEANHYNGAAYAQSLPITYIKKWPLQNCLEINEPVLYGGLMFNHFGHFVVESLCRLYAYPIVKEFDPFVLFYTPWNQPRYLEKDNFVHQIISGFEIPIKRLILVEQTTKIREVIIPEQKYGFGFAQQPDELFVNFTRSFRFERKFPNGMKGTEKIYISRSRLQNRGRLIGEKIFEKYLIEEGYSIFSPEEHTFYEQLTLYSYAKKIIFSDGSSLLPCIFLSDLKADVAVVCRRHEPNQHMSSTAVCLQGYYKNFLWIDAVSEQYQFGLDNWNALADIDWHKASEFLLEHGFVNKPFRIMSDEEHLALVRLELKDYIRKISGNSQFVDYMMSLKEK